MTRAIGIDLGTTRSIIATVHDGKPLVIPNSEGQLTTPSVVAVTAEGKVLVGQPAKMQADPRRTASSIKRYMGTGQRFFLGNKAHTPQELAGHILSKLKSDAESYLGERVEQAVIGVPAYFGDRQRQATKEAAALAGLQVLRLVAEPTAAALAYGMGREEAHTILVWDLGGGTFDVSVLDLGEDIFEVRAVSGDNWLGGDDFDTRVVRYLAAEMARGSSGGLPKDPSAWQQLQEVAERTKVELSVLPEVPIRVSVFDAAQGPRQLETTLTREQLEALTADLLKRLGPPVRQVLADAGLAPQSIDRVILVGNGTRMPAVRRIAKELLGQEPYRYIDPDLVVAWGCAIHAGMLLGEVHQVALLDVLPLSLGVEAQGGLTARIVLRNTPLPTSGSRIFTNAVDDQTSMNIHVVQGEREMAADNISLGQFQLYDIFPAPRGGAKVEVTFQADVDGIIHVTAANLQSGDEVKVQLTSTKQLDPREIDHLAREAKARMAEDPRKQAGLEPQAMPLSA